MADFELECKKTRTGVTVTVKPDDEPVVDPPYAWVYKTAATVPHDEGALTKSGGYYSGNFKNAATAEVEIMYGLDSVRKGCKCE